MDPEVSTHLERLRKLRPEVDESSRIEIEKPLIEDHEIQPKTGGLDEALKKVSPYFKNIAQRHNEMLIRIRKNNKNEEADCNNTERIVNDYFCPKFAERLLEYYIPLLPLWTGMMLPISFPDASIHTFK